MVPYVQSLLANLFQLTTLLPHYNMVATKNNKEKSASSCFQHLSAKFALFWF